MKNNRFGVLNLAVRHCLLRFCPAAPLQHGSNRMQKPPTTPHSVTSKEILILWPGAGLVLSEMRRSAHPVQGGFGAAIVLLGAIMGGIIPAADAQSPSHLVPVVTDNTPLPLSNNCLL